MAFSEETRAAILEALGRKVPSIRPCAVCGQDKSFILGDGLMNLEVVDAPWLNIVTMGTTTRLMPRRFAPLIQLICINCGNTYLLNTTVLEIGHLFGGFGGGPPAPDTPPGALGEEG